MADLDAEYFDGWYAAMGTSPRQNEIQQRTLGLPPSLESTSLLPWTGIADVVTALGVGAGEVLVDLACGRGGYGLEVARRTGVTLHGVDFSAVAIDRARTRAAADWPDVAADFRVGDLLGTGLDDGVADAVMCIDAMQFADPYAAGLAEGCRILRAGARLVLTGWQPLDLTDDSVPPRLRRDIGESVRAAGFEDVVVHDMTAWQQAERAMWEAALATDPEGDAALESMRAEGARALPMMGRVRRVMVTSRAPRVTAP